MGTHLCGFRTFFTDGQRHNRQLQKLLSPRKQLLCGAKRHVTTPRNSRTGITWKTWRFGLERCDLALKTQPGFSTPPASPAPCHSASPEPPVLALWFPCVLTSFLVVMSCSPPNPSPTSPLSPSWPMFSAPSSPMPTSSTSSDSSPIRSVAGFVCFFVAAVVLSLAWSSLHAVFSLLVNFVPCHPNLHLLFDRPEEAVREDSR